MPRSVEAAPYSAFVGTEEVSVQRFDDVFARHHCLADRPFLKIDVQGYERQVLAGSEDFCNTCWAYSWRSALCRFTKACATFGEVLSLLELHGFRLMSFEPVFADKSTGQLLQVDGVFMRDTARAA